MRCPQSTAVQRRTVQDMFRSKPFRYERTDFSVVLKNRRMPPKSLRWEIYRLRRGLFRIWLLLSAGWILSWFIDLVLGVLEDGFKKSDFLVMPVLLFAP